MEIINLKSSHAADQPSAVIAVVVCSSLWCPRTTKALLDLLFTVVIYTNCTQEHSTSSVHSTRPIRIHFTSATEEQTVSNGTNSAHPLIKYIFCSAMNAFNKKASGTTAALQMQNRSVYEEDEVDKRQKSAGVRQEKCMCTEQTSLTLVVPLDEC